MANPITGIFRALSSAISSVTTVVETSANAADSAMSTLNLHAQEYERRVKHGYKTDFEIYKLEKQADDQDRLLALRERKAKQIEKFSKITKNGEELTRFNKESELLNDAFQAALEAARAIEE